MCDKKHVSKKIKREKCDLNHLVVGHGDRFGVPAWRSAGWTKGERLSWWEKVGKGLGTRGAWWNKGMEQGDWFSSEKFFPERCIPSGETWLQALRPAVFSEVRGFFFWVRFLFRRVTDFRSWGSLGRVSSLNGTGCLFRFAWAVVSVYVYCWLIIQIMGRETCPRVPSEKTRSSIAQNQEIFLKNLRENCKKWCEFAERSQKKEVLREIPIKFAAII